MKHHDILLNAGLENKDFSKGTLNVYTPITGALIGSVTKHTTDDVEKIIKKSNTAFQEWRNIPAPRHGELVRLLGNELQEEKENLGRLVSLECGKSYQEGLGEVQEMIDICIFATGLSRQLYGKTIASERAGHHMRETWHPMGVCGVITAFNFPVAVWAWNTALALVCGNAVIWKPSEKTPLTAIACQKIFERALKKFGDAPDNLNQIIIGDATIGNALVESKNVAIISATGSTNMGRIVGQKVAARFGRSILELGGNNAMIVAPSADLDMAARAILFSAVGTAGQRCTSLRRLIVHHDIYDTLLEKLKIAYNSVTIGDPLNEDNLIGSLIDKDAFEQFKIALKTAQKAGGTLHGGKRVLIDEHPDAYYVQPAIMEMKEQSAIMKQETFAPILYVVRYQNINEAITIHNDVPQGLSSSIFSTDMRETELFLSAIGSDCGIVNVNIGTSGAEIGGAFGGEKETGGGRESGSDAWKGYMRRMTSTVNYSTELPLAQGVKFGESK